jgi:hypothetical protein
MRIVLQISTVLSWINLIVGSYLLLSGLYGAFAVHDVKIMLTVVVFIGAIVLHSYAAIQLRKSIIRPNKPLSRETPIGIRFFGFMSIFCSFVFVATGTFILQNLAQVAKDLTLPFNSKNIDVKSFLPGIGIFILIFGVTIAVNVIVNLRLLKWYLAFKNQGGNQTPNQNP